MGTVGSRTSEEVSNQEYPHGKVRSGSWGVERNSLFCSYVCLFFPNINFEIYRGLWYEGRRWASILLGKHGSINRMDSSVVILFLPGHATSWLKNTRAKERAESWKPATKGSFQGHSFMNAWDAVRSTGSAL